MHMISVVITTKVKVGVYSAGQLCHLQGVVYVQGSYFCLPESLDGNVPGI